MRKIARCLILVAVAVASILCLPEQAHAQFPVAVTQVQPVVPAVVGYTAERRGLFGWRTVYRPIVAPVATGIPVASTVTVARPVISQPVVMGFAPQPAPVTSFFAPPVSVGIPVTQPITSFSPPVTTFSQPVTTFSQPVTTFRVPVTTVVPVIGF